MKQLENIWGDGSALFLQKWSPLVLPHSLQHWSDAVFSSGTKVIFKPSPNSQTQALAQKSYVKGQIAYSKEAIHLSCPVPSALFLESQYSGTSEVRAMGKTEM